MLQSNFSNPELLGRLLSQERPATSPLLSVVMPVFNERETIRSIAMAVLSCRVRSLELVIVDDGSTDGTGTILENEIAKLDRVRVLRHEQNRGRGAALRTAIAAARGEYVIVQDADLEYDPSDYPRLLEPLLLDLADAVYGSRFLGGARRVENFWHSLANHVVTTASNVVTDLGLTDVEGGHKAFRRTILESIRLSEDRFGFAPELTAKLARAGARIYEVPITYRGRTWAEGKKLGLKDALRAFYCIGKYGLLRRP
jgi:glycosyltransferase involved in cell wall biosynthesis